MRPNDTLRGILLGTRRVMRAVFLTALVIDVGAACRATGARPSPIQTDTTADHEAPGSVRYRPDLLHAVGVELARRSLYDSSAPPAYGLAMQDALRQFQRRQGLTITGRLDSLTLGALGLQRFASAPFSSPQDTVRTGSAPRLSVRFGTGGPYRAEGAGVAWRQQVRIPGATSVRLYFDQLDLGPGHRLIIRNARGEQVATYESSQRAGFWTGYLAPAPVTLEIHTSGPGSGGGVRVTRAQARFESAAAQDTNAAESVIGGDDTEPIGSFGTGTEIYQRGSAVAVLVDENGDGFCTGFLIGPSRFMTNNHCIATQRECTDARARFNFQLNAAGIALPTTDYDCVALLQTDDTRDYTVVQLEHTPGYEWGYFRLTWDNVFDNEALVIIGHPGGLRKRVSRINCSVSDPVSPASDGTAEIDFSHVCDTQGGNSGSPVLDLRHFEVIGLHHTGLGQDADNEAVRMRRILAHCIVCAQPFAPPGRRFDADGDGREDAYVRSPDWAGVVRSASNSFSTSWIRGDWVGSWNLGQDNWDLAANLDGDAYSDIVLRSPDWIGTLRGSAAGPTFTWLRGDTVGTWNIDFDDNALVGDFTGDGKDDLLVRSDEGIGILGSDGTRLHSLWVANDWLGQWNLGRPDRMWVGDFTGDGKDDVFIRSPEWAGLFRSTGSALEEIWMTHDWLGQWNLGDADEHFVGDFNADGKADILTRSDEWISLWISNGTGFTVPWIKNDWVGSWNLGWKDVHNVADFTGDGKDDVLIRSNEWIGLLVSNGSSLASQWLQFDWLGEWNIGLPDRVRVGHYDNDNRADVMIRSPEWLGLFTSTGTSLQFRFIRNDWLGQWNLGEVDRLIGGR